MTNRIGAECVDFVAWREARRPHGIAETMVAAPGEEAGVAREWDVAGIGCWQCEGELKSVRWNVIVDPVTGYMLHRIVCDGKVHEHEMRPEPDETETERKVREGVMHYLTMVLGVPFRVQRQVVANAMPLLLMLSLVA